jgi:predicted permease
MRGLFKDVLIATRQLSKYPVISAVAIVTLALGLGATTAVFSLAESVLLRPLPFSDPKALVLVGDRVNGATVTGTPAVPAAEIRNYLTNTHAFSSLGAYGLTSSELSGSGDPVKINMARLSAGVMPTLGVAPFLGREFSQQDDDSHEAVAILSYALWQDRFGGNRAVLGTKVLLDRKAYLVIGVMPRGFEFPIIPGRLSQSQLWVPMSLTPEEIRNGVASWNFGIVARLRSGISVKQAQQDANRVAMEIMRGYPPFMASLHIEAVVKPMQADSVGHAKPLLKVLLLSVVFVLLIACANLAALLLVRAVQRRREIAVRIALGATARELLKQAMLEGLVLSLSGGLIGLALAEACLRTSVALLPESFPRVNEIGIDWAVVAFAVLVAVLTGVGCALAPAYAAIRTNPTEAMRDGGNKGSTARGEARVRSFLVISEIAIGLCLVTASGLLLKSYEKMSSVDLGFEPEHVATASYALPSETYSTQSSVDTFNHELLRRLDSLPAAQASAISSTLPMSGAPGIVEFVPERSGAANDNRMHLAGMSLVQGNYFHAMGIPLLRGRVFTQSDDAQGQLVVVVNHRLAEHYWPGQDPVGKRLRMGTPEMQTLWMNVIGEVGDVKSVSPDTDSYDAYYQPVEQFQASVGTLGSASNVTGAGGYIVVRSGLPADELVASLRSTVRQMDPQLALSHVQTLDEGVAMSEAPRCFNTVVIAGFASVAVLLMLVGIYSIVAFSAALRTQEVALRMALGAQRRGIVTLVIGSGMRLAAAGCAIGLMGTFLVAHLLKSLLFGISAFDPLVLILAVASILTLALIGSAMPALRAASIDPMTVLKGE